MKEKTVNLQLRGDRLTEVVDTLDHYGFDANLIGDKLDEAFSMYLYGEHKNGTDDSYRAHWVHAAIVDAKKIIRAIAAVAKDATIEEKDTLLHH